MEKYLESTICKNQKRELDTITLRIDQTQRTIIQDRIHNLRLFMRIDRKEQIQTI